MNKRSLWRVVQWVTAALVLWLVVGYVRRYWGEISAVEIRLDFVWAGVGLVLVLVSNVIQISLFRYFLRYNGLPLDFLSVWRIYSLPQAGKYLPGKVTAVAALSYMLKGAGLSLAHALAAIFVFNVVSLLSGLLVGLMLFPVWAPHASPTAIVLCIGTAVVTVPVVCTRGFWQLVNWGLTRFNRSALPSYPPWTAMTRLMFGWIIYWFVFGSGMFATTRFLIEVPLAWLPLLVASFSLSYFASALVVLAPAGLGVREALLIGIMSHGSTPAFASIFAAVTRLVLVLNDVVVIGSAWLLLRNRRLPGDRG